MRALLLCFSFTLRRNYFEKISYLNLTSKGCLLTHWLPMTSILFWIVRSYGSLFKWNFLKNEIIFLEFLLHLWNLHQTLNIFKERKNVINNVFPKLQSVKDLLRPLSKRGRFRTSFDRQHIKGSQRLPKIAWEHFYHIFLSLWGGNGFGNISVIELWNHRCVSWHIDCRLELSCSGLGEFVFPYANPIILKTKNVFYVFCASYGIYIKF